jgi:hypothetical protein
MTLATKKEIGIVVLVLLCSIAAIIGTGVLLRQAFTQPQVLFVLVGVVVGEVTLLAFALAFMASPWALMAIIIAPPLMFSAVGQLHWGAIAGGVVLGLLLLNARYSLVNELGDRLHYRTIPIFRSSCRGVLAGVVLASIGLSYPIMIERVRSGEINIEPILFEPLFRPLGPLVANLIPGYTSDQTLDELIAQQVKNSSGADGSSEIRRQQQLLIRQQLAQRTNQQLTGRETIAEVTAYTVGNYIGGMANRYPVVAASLNLIIIFLAFGALVPLLVWPILLVMSALVAVAQAGGLLHKVAHTTTIERLQLIPE